MRAITIYRQISVNRFVTILTVMLISLTSFADEPVKTSLSNGDGEDPYVLHLRTNLLYDVLAVPNIGAEFGVNDRMSIVGNVMLDWIGISTKQFYWRIFSGDLEWRYWLGADESTFLRKGHHLGVYAAFYRYDVELGTLDGEMGDFNYGGGVSYGYSAPLSRSLSLDMSIGIGYMGGKYKKYKYIDGRYVWQSDDHKNYFGPTKAEVTLVWHWELPKRKSTAKKGGQP